MDGQKIIPQTTYGQLITALSERNLVPRATSLEHRLAVQESLSDVMLSLKEAGSATDEEALFVLSMITGQSPRGNPRSIIRDFGVYCALLCYHTELAVSHFRQEPLFVNDERVFQFLPQLFCVAVHRTCSSLACSILKVASEYLVETGVNPHENIRSYFAVLLPVFFLATAGDGLIEACSVLGANYLQPEEVALLLNVHEGNADLLRDYALASHSKPYVPILKALLLGSCMKKSRSSRKLVELIMEKLFSVNHRRLTYSFFSLLLSEAERADNKEVVDYLNELSFVE